MSKKPISSSKRAPQQRTKTSPSFPLKLTQLQQDSLLLYTRLRPAVEKKIKAADTGTQLIKCSKNELDHMHDEIGQAVVYARNPHKQRLVAVQKKVDGILDEIQLQELGAEGLMQFPQPTTESELLIQLRIMLLEVRPTIWRRIVIEDCFLDELHEHIQLAMGWENGHMHRFTIEGERYGRLMPDDFDMEYLDESQVKLSDFLPKSGKRFHFRYEYDFGDSWQHEILFEGYPATETGSKLPLCLEGERACPPEDIGGPWGYAEYLDALADPDHECDVEFMEWSSTFDPEEFLAEKMTRAMSRGMY
ncbi:MAG: plasmid pRiA4b ORF-3 family protein [Pseudomonadota bacterium]